MTSLLRRTDVQACLEAVRQARRERQFSPALKKLDIDIGQVILEHPNAGKWFWPGDDRSLQRVLTRIADIEIKRALLVTAIALS